MEEIIKLSALTPLQKQTLSARYIPAIKAASRNHAIFGTIYWLCVLTSVLCSVATSIFVATGSAKTASETITIVFAVVSSVGGSMMLLVKSLKINEFYFNSVSADLESLVWILITATVPDWDSFVTQFDALQKRERGKLQEIAAEMQDRQLRNARDINGDDLENASAE